MTYDEAMDATVTRSEAEYEIIAHDADWAKFVAEYGDHVEYAGADVLGWLGY